MSLNFQSKIQFHNTTHWFAYNETANNDLAYIPSHHRFLSLQRDIQMLELTLPVNSRPIICPVPTTSL